MLEGTENASQVFAVRNGTRGDSFTRREAQQKTGTLAQPGACHQGQQAKQHCNRQWLHTEHQHKVPWLGVEFPKGETWMFVSSRKLSCCTCSCSSEAGRSEAVGIVANVRSENSHVCMVLILLSKCVPSVMRAGRFEGIHALRTAQQTVLMQSSWDAAYISHRVQGQGLVQQLLLKLSSCQPCLCRAMGSCGVRWTLTCRASPREQWMHCSASEGFIEVT